MESSVFATGHSRISFPLDSPWCFWTRRESVRQCARHGVELLGHVLNFGEKTRDLIKSPPPLGNFFAIHLCLLSCGCRSSRFGTQSLFTACAWLCNTLRDIQYCRNLWRMGLDYVLVLRLLKHLQKTTRRLAVRSRKLSVAWLRESNQLLISVPQLDEDVQFRKDVRDRHGDCVAEVGFWRLVIWPMVTAGATQQSTQV